MELTVTNRSKACPKFPGLMLLTFAICRLYILAQWLSWLERRPVTAEVEGSSPFWVVSERNFRTNGIIAQLGEHLPYKQGVTGSSPVGPIKPM